MRGFSLLEVLVTLLIFSIIMIAIFMVLAIHKSSFFINDAAIELHQDMRNAIAIMDRQLRQTKSSVITAGPIADDDLPYNLITFRIPEDVDGDGDVISSLGTMEWSGTITYSLNANRQIIRTTSRGTLVLANHVSALSFTRFSTSPDIIRLAITVGKTTVFGRVLSDNIVSSVKMRN